MYAGVSLDQAPPEDIPFRFFLTAPVFGILAGLLIVFDGSNLFITNWSVETVALTHIITLGWLTMIMFGAFYQMVPVLVGGTVPFIKISRIVHLLLTSGVLLLVVGLYYLLTYPILIALHLLAVAFLIFIAQVLIALFKVTADRPTVVAMRISVISLLVAVLLGLLFSGAHAGWWGFPIERVRITSIHMILALFGWVGTLIMGVGFHVIPMFYMTPDFPLKRARWILRLQVISLICSPLALLSGLNSLWVLVAGIPGIAGVAIFAMTMRSLLNRRKRKIIDTTIRFWQMGLISMLASMVPLAIIPLTDTPLIVFSFGLLFILGYAVFITNGMLYKIVPFLVWFHRFSLLIGKANVPLMMDISPDKVARRQWKVSVALLIVLVAGAMAGNDYIIRAGGLILAISSGMLMKNLIRMVRMKVPDASN